MHREFCTLFDSNYLIKAIALYQSLVRHCDSFHLTAFCFDGDAKRLLDELALPRFSTVALTELEAFDADLSSVKADRTPAEYCWTATPAVPLYVFGTRPEVNEVTYLDADLMFFSDPEPLFEEMGDASVGITPHRFSPEYADQAVHGKYNVQFLPFRRDEPGVTALRWWHERCVEWCYSRLEDGKFGDQKYLDDWPDRFAGVHVFKHKGGGLAPWNIAQYEIRQATTDAIQVDGDPLIFYHYHRVRLLRNGDYESDPHAFFIPPLSRRLIYEPYFSELTEASRLVRSIEPAFAAGMVEPVARVGRERLGHAVGRFPMRALSLGLRAMSAVRQRAR